MTGAKFLDLGAGDGRVVIAASLCGATCAEGYELPANVASKFPFDAVRDMCAPLVPWWACHWQAQDIMQLRTLPTHPEAVYTFWVGMGPATQGHILNLVRECFSVKSLFVFRDRNWSTPASVCEVLNQGLGDADVSGGAFRHISSHPLSMYGSGEGKTGWLFRRCARTSIADDGV